jgi:hypothetical protein
MDIDDSGTYPPMIDRDAGVFVLAMQSIIRSIFFLTMTSPINLGPIRPLAPTRPATVRSVTSTVGHSVIVIANLEVACGHRRLQQLVRG